jgi:hypothetical protein
MFRLLIHHRQAITFMFGGECYFGIYVKIGLYKMKIWKDIFCLINYFALLFAQSSSEIVF